MWIVVVIKPDDIEVIECKKNSEAHNVFKEKKKEPHEMIYCAHVSSTDQPGVDLRQFLREDDIKFDHLQYDQLPRDEEFIPDIRPGESVREYLLRLGREGVWSAEGLLEAGGHRGELREDGTVWLNMGGLTDEEYRILSEISYETMQEIRYLEEGGDILRHGAGNPIFALWRYLKKVIRRQQIL